MNNHHIVPWLKISAKQRPNGELVITAPVIDQPCGACTLCCRIMPVAELGKTFNTRCAHQSTPFSAKPGCAIYDKRPVSCRLWSCLFPLHEDFPAELRPDRCHVIFDMNTDLIWLDEARTQERRVFQMWIDPDWPDAHEAEPVRTMIERLAQMSGFPTLARRSSSDGFLIVPPALTQHGEWLIIRSDFPAIPDSV